MGTVFALPRMFRPTPMQGDDVSNAFGVCCGALNGLSPKSREMVTRWLHERYAAQLEEDMAPVDGVAQSMRDQIYAARVERDR